MKKGILIHPDELTRQWIDRMADNGINTVGIHPVGREFDSCIKQKSLQVAGNLYFFVKFLKF